MTKKPRSLREKLDESLTALDKDTEEALHKRRRRSLQPEPVVTSRPQPWWAFGGAAGISLCLAAILWFSTQTGPELPDSGVLLTDAELLSAPEDLQLFEELELYDWLLAEKES